MIWLKNDGCVQKLHPIINEGIIEFDMEMGINRIMIFFEKDTGVTSTKIVQ